MIAVTLEVHILCHPKKSGLSWDIWQPLGRRSKICSTDCHVLLVVRDGLQLCPFEVNDTWKSRDIGRMAALSSGASLLKIGFGVGLQWHLMETPLECQSLNA